jgi:cysteine desulfurase
LGKLDVDFRKLRIDCITFNGQNIHGPQGTGGLYLREDVELSPFILGGMEQGGLRGGDLNFPALIGLGYAAKEVKENRDLMCTEVARLRDRLETGIQKEIASARILFEESDRLPNCTAMAFPGVSNEALLYSLNQKGVLAGFGGNNFQKIDLILRACGIDENLACTAVSFSLSRFNTTDEIDQAIDIIVDSVKELKNISNKIVDNDSEK